MYSKNFIFAFNKLHKIEGSYSDHASDSGGKTNWGITEKLARQYGYTGDMKKLPLDLAQKISYEMFWKRMRCDYVSDKDIAFKLFERYFHTGLRKTPVKILQRAINVFNYRGKLCADVAVDGYLGNETENALISMMNKNEMVKSRILKALNVFQAVGYFELAEAREKDEDFVGGWFDNRIQI